MQGNQASAHDGDQPLTYSTMLGKQRLKYKFLCPRCEQRISADADVQGTEVSCPSCEFAFVAPPPPPPAPSPSPPPLPSNQVREEGNLSTEEANDFDDSDAEAWRIDPATDRQKKKLKFFGIKINRGMTKGEASDLIEAAVDEHPEIEDAYQAAKEKEQDQEEDLGFLDHLINDEETREIGDFKKLTEAQLREFLAYLSANVPRWKEMSRFDLGISFRDFSPIG